MAQGTIKEKLVAALKIVSEDPEFLLSVINHVKIDRDRLALVDYITANNPTYEDVLLLSIAIHDERSEE